MRPDAQRAEDTFAPPLIALVVGQASLLLGMTGVEKHQARHFIGISARVRKDEQAAERMPGKHVRRRDVRRLQQSMQLVNHMLRIAWLGTTVAPP